MTAAPPSVTSGPCASLAPATTPPTRGPGRLRRALPLLGPAVVAATAYAVFA